MSIANEPAPIGPHDPMQYVPRRRRPVQRSAAAADDVPALRENRREIIGGSISLSTPPDHEPPRRRFNSQAMSESLALGRKMERRGRLCGAASRSIEAIGVSVILTLFVATTMPALRQSYRAQLFAAALQPFTKVLSQKRPGEDAPKSVLAELQGPPAPGDTTPATERERPEKQSDKILRRFLQWRQMTSPREAAE